MLNKRFILILLLVGFTGLGNTLPQEANDDNPQKKELLLHLLIQGLNQIHYQPRELDNEFSQQVFDQYVRRLDAGKRFLHADDVRELQAYRQLLDEEISKGSFNFFDLSFERVQQRIGEAKLVYEEVIEQPFDFSRQESIELEFDELQYANNSKELRETWRRFIKFYTLRNLYTMQKSQDDKLAEGKLDGEPLSFEEMEAKSREKVKKNFDRYFKNLTRLEERDRLSEYFNAITSVFDPHTVYYAPKDKEDFDLEFSGRMEGIGAQLTERDDFITVSRIVIGSACWRQGDLEVNDVILKVAQKEEEPVDVVGMRLDDAVQLIRGPKDTQVTLTVKKVNGVIKEIPIIRDVVEFEHNYARSAVIEKETQKVGYIKLPSFYADFNELGGRRCAEDVRTEIIKLKGEGVDRLILDLRNNGGGSLADVVEMAGLFIPDGPVVQVKGRRGPAKVLSDTDTSVVWEGPLVVMVNGQSASASEILAGAIQDYGRGVIVGVGNRTFGKGTVQQIIDMDRLLRPNVFEELKPLGSVMLTTQKFYRIDGTTNQLKGVVPDIILPDTYSYIESGEKELDFAIPWDEIDEADFDSWNRAMENVDQLRQTVSTRMDTDPRFSLINESALRLKERRDNSSIALNYEAYTTQQRQLEDESKNLEKITEEIPDLTILTPEVDLPELQSDSTKLARNEAMHMSLKKDIYLNEALYVINGLEID